jgi:hypothetical protein
MAASDIGFAMNGHIVAECAAFQLPTVNDNHHKYFRLFLTLAHFIAPIFPNFITALIWT